MNTDRSGEFKSLKIRSLKNGISESVKLRRYDRTVHAGSPCFGFQFSLLLLLMTRPNLSPSIIKKHLREIRDSDGTGRSTSSL